MNQVFRSQSPTRIDLAGGTLDLWPLYTFLGGATTINFGIDIFTESELTLGTDDDVISLEIQNQKWTFANLAGLLASHEPYLSVLQEVIKYVSKKSKIFERGFRLVSRSLSPVGGGLGGSSSLLITYLKLVEQIDPSLRLEPLARIHMAHNLEARVLKTPTGLQDYFPPSYSGLNFIHFSDEGVSVEVQPIPDEIARSFFLVYTGKPHHSGLNNFDVIKKVVAKDAETFSALEEIHAITRDLEKVLKQKKWKEIPELLNRENATRIRLSAGFSSPEILKLQSLVKPEAEALKICGAGGGGCVLIWAPPEKHETIQTKCLTAGFQILNSKATAPFKGF